MKTVDSEESWTIPSQNMGVPEVVLNRRPSNKAMEVRDKFSNYFVSPTAVDTTMKKAGAGVVLKATEVKTAKVKKPTEGSTMKVTDNLRNEVTDGMLQLASGKSVPVMMNCAALSDPEKTKSLRLPILRGEIDGREVDVMRDTGCEGVVVKRQLVDAGQLTEMKGMVTKVINKAGERTREEVDAVRKQCNDQMNRLTEELHALEMEGAEKQSRLERLM
ncbi:sodium channel and clathrin linker 1 [Elysia marginata]|uniref:Sodium channel and clathrin linker 1 n=1 Tax=Elysia marginata TaxID=1093978 RepID=A0AAV4I4M0_9GAST|nr:sodium channel and clathrin linker 1 [Elysia marginata]